VFTVQAYQTSQYVVPRGSIFLSKGRSSFAEEYEVRTLLHPSIEKI
jgi:hypothetical protein